MNSYKTGFGLLLVTVMILGMFAVPSQASLNYTEANGKVTVQTNNLWVEVTGNSNTPSYFFRGQSETNHTRHRAQFVELFEFQDTNNNSRYDQNDTRVESSLVALASLNVDLGAVSNTGSSSTAVSFNMSMTAKALINLQFSKITFDNHISDKNDTKLKFDVIIDNYSFSAHGDMLALAFRLSSTVSNHTTYKHNNQSSQVEFGQHAYLSSNNTATAGGQQLNVGMTVNETANGQIMTYFAYPRFTGKLVHDPSLGMDSSSSGGSSSGTTNTTTSSTSTGDLSNTTGDTMPYSMFFGLLPLLVIPVVIRRRNQ